MSKASEAKRAAARAAETMAPEDVPAEGTAVLFGVWCERGRGWASVRVELPISVAEQYAVETHEPDIRAIAVGRVVADLERHAMNTGPVER